MPGIRFRHGNKKDIFLYRTEVENLFINEYLPSAPGDYVKVFLFALMYAQIGEAVSSETIAFTLGLSADEVEAAWSYWESRGLIRLLPGEDGEIELEYIRQVDLLYGKIPYAEPEPRAAGEEAAAGRAVSAGVPAASYDEEAAGLIYTSADREQEAETTTQDDTEAEDIIARLIDRQLQSIFSKYERTTGRTISKQETRKLTEAVRLYNIEPDVLDFAITYCAEIEKYSVDYIFKVALRWTGEGCRDVASVKSMLDARSLRNDYYRNVFRALGFTRLAAPADREMMDSWLDDMGFTVQEVLDACSMAVGLRDPNLRYVAKVLENRMLEKGGVNTRTAQSQGRAEVRAEGSGMFKTGREGTPAGNTAGGQARVSRKVLREYYEYIRSEDDKERRARIDDARLRIPGMKEVLAAEAEINRAVISITPGSDAPAKRRSLREKRQEIEKEKRSLLERSGRPADYLDRHYRCGICRDTGYTDEGRVCTCAEERADEAYRWILSTGKK